MGEGIPEANKCSRSVAFRVVQLLRTTRISFSHNEDLTRRPIPFLIPLAKRRPRNVTVV